MPNLNQITLRSGMYLGFRYGFGTLISLANMLVLTWWIGPHAYGMFVTVIGLSGFLASLARTGADTYLVRMERPPDQKLYHLAMTLIGANAIALLAIGVMIIPLLVRWFGNCEFVAPYLASLLTIPLTGWAGPPTAKLERGLEFGKVSGIELAGQFLALIGVGYTMSLRAWQLRTLVNPMIVGRLAGPESVAYVGLAIRIAEGLGFVRIAAGRLAIAALSRLREDSVRMRRASQRALELQVMMLGPLLCGFALAAPIVFSYLIGSRWLSSLTVFPWVAAAILANSVYNLQASALFVLGEQWTVFRASMFQVFLLALCTWWLLPKFGISGYGCADLIACIAYFDLHATLAKTVSLSYRRLAAWTLSLSAPLFCVLQIHRQFKFLLWAPLLLVVTHELHSRQAGRKRVRKSFENSQTGEILIPASTGD